MLKRGPRPCEAVVHVHGNPVFAGQGTTIFTVMSALAVEHGAINLGQGFPDEDGPLDAARSGVARADRRARTSIRR